MLGVPLYFALMQTLGRFIIGGAMVIFGALIRDDDDLGFFSGKRILRNLVKCLSWKELTDVYKELMRDSPLSKMGWPVVVVMVVGMTILATIFVAACFAGAAVLIVSLYLTARWWGLVSVLFHM